eukprot:1378963-Amphidinium_carterae.1
MCSSFAICLFCWLESATSSSCPSSIESGSLKVPYMPIGSMQGCLLNPAGVEFRTGMEPAAAIKGLTKAGFVRSRQMECKGQKANGGLKRRIGASVT